MCWYFSSLVSQLLYIVCMGGELQLNVFMASAAFKYVRQKAATTFAFSSASFFLYGYLLYPLARGGQPAAPCAGAAAPSSWTQRSPCSPPSSILMCFWSEK